MEINIIVDENLEGCPQASWLQSIAEQVLVAEGADSSAELGLVIVNQSKIQELNLKYLGRDEPTDVIAFPMLPEPPAAPAEKEPPSFVRPPDGVAHLGEVIVSCPQAVIQAEERRHSVEKELAILIIHGILHLLGYDHEDPAPRRRMRAREAEILGGIKELS